MPIDFVNLRILDQPEDMYLARKDADEHRQFVNDKASIDEEFADWFGVGGPASYVADRLGELVEIGVDYFGSALIGAERERFARDVMPAVRR